MAVVESPIWWFEPVDPRASGASGKITDLFRNEGGAARGILALGAPSFAATLMAREVIQNSWDAARELRRDVPGLEPFAIDFEFGVAAGDAKQVLVDALGLSELAMHAAAVASTPEERKKLGLGSGDCLLDLDDAPELSYCTIVEHGASGMYGPWTGAESHMYLAMLSIGFNEKDDGSGGTFGYGKAGLIRASHPRIVVAYSCFLERESDPGITRRLLGVTYWGRHKRDGVSLTGFARLGSQVSADEVVPFTNERADEVAALLGLEVRDPAKATQLGTTFLVIDPSVEPDDLCVAIERNWFPALLDEWFNVEITSPDGSIQSPRPRVNPQLTSFVEAYELVESGAPVGGGRVSKVIDLGTYSPQGSTSYSIGRLGLVADTDGWSFPDETDDDADTSGSRSLVALTRDPRMVVDYHPPGRDISRRSPFVRGVFVAHRDVNAHLGNTEPKGHDKWDTKEDDDVEQTSTKIAVRILDSIKNHVRDFQNELRPPVDQSAAVRLSRLDEKLRNLRNQEGSTPPPPPPGDRPFSFRLDVQRTADSGGLVLSGSVDVHLADGVPEPSLRARIRIAFALDEDGRRGDVVPLLVTAPPGFQPVDGDASRFDGDVTDAPARFKIVSDSYRADWTGELLVTGERLGSEAGGGSS